MQPYGPISLLPSAQVLKLTDSHLLRHERQPPEKEVNWYFRSIRMQSAFASNGGAHVDAAA
jgi:hypothetical protein